MRKLTIPTVFLILLLSLTACNTIEGVGKDIGAAGDAIEGAAKKNKKK